MHTIIKDLWWDIAPIQKDIYEEKLIKKLVLEAQRERERKQAHVCMIYMCRSFWLLALALNLVGDSLLLFKAAFSRLGRPQACSHFPAAAIYLAVGAYCYYRLLYFCAGLQIRFVSSELSGLAQVLYLPNFSPCTDVF